MAIEGYREINYARGYICALGNKASVYTEYGKYEQARLLFDSCLSLSYKEGIMEFRLSYLKNLYNNYFKAGNYQKAFEYETSYYMLKDSLFDIEKTKAITTLTLKYEKEKYQARILNLEKESLKRKNQRNATIFSAIGVSLLVLFVMLYLRQRAVKDRIIAEQKVRQLEEEKKLMAAKFLVEGQEEERKRIARELHDGLGVLLSATKMQFTTIKDMSPENRPMIERATQLLEQATGDVRKISHNMMPGLLTKLGFYEAVEDLFDNLNDSEDLSAECEISGDQERLPENKEIMLYRVIQEMVNNTIKHAQAHNIRLKIDIRPDMMDIVYTDDGKGFDLEKKMESETESIGLKSIQSRVNFLNGTLTMDSSPGKGVIYTMHVPVSAVPAT
jgi:signal transduction histidine kinase